MSGLLETQIIYQEDMFIPDWDEKMENEFYPEGAIILMENMFLQRGELGWSIDTEKNLDRALWDEVLEYRKYLSQYGEVYINDDYNNFYASKYFLSSQVGITGEKMTVFGKSITDRFQAVTAPLHNMKGPSVIILKFDKNSF